MTQKRYFTVKVKRVRCVEQRKKLSLFEIVKQLLEYTSSNQLYDEEKILLSCLQFIVKKLKKKHALKKSQLREVFTTADKATNTAVNTHIRFESSSSDSERSRSRSRSERDEDEQVSSVNENELMEIHKTYEKRIELLNDKIRRQCNEIKERSSQQHKEMMTTDERSTVFVTSTIFMAIVTSSWLYFVIYNTDIVSEEQGNIIFSNILFVQIMFIVMLVRCFSS